MGVRYSFHWDPIPENQGKSWVGATFHGNAGRPRNDKLTWDMPLEATISLISLGMSSSAGAT